MTTLLTERVVPHTIEAERSVLGTILVHAECLPEVTAVMKPAHFFRKAHATIYRHILALDQAGKGVDFLTVSDALKTAGELEGVGGRAYLSALTDGVPRSTNVKHYAGLVRQKARLRAVIDAANTMRDEAYEATDDADEVIDRAEQALFDLAEGETQRGFTKLSDILPGVLKQIESWHASKGAVTGVASGFGALDWMTRGFQPGNLVIIAARPGIGKSALVLDIARNVAVKQSVALFSLEMSEDELAIRSVAATARLDGHRLQSGMCSEAELRRVGPTFSTLSELHLHINDAPFLSVNDVRSQCRRLKAQHGLDLIIVDYAQLMLGHGDKKESRTLELGATTRGLKALAKDLQVPVIALSQLNRDLERRENKRPLLSDLRESGAIEQDADLILFIYRDEAYNQESPDKGIAELIVAKHRSGPVGTVRLAWIAEETRFADLEQRYADQALPIGK